MKRLKVLAVSIFPVVGLCLYMASPQKAGANPSGDAKAGFDVNKQNCAKCHGEGGKGDGPAGKLLKTKPADWTDKSKMSKLSNDDLFNIISKGGGSVGKSKLMPAFGEKLSTEQIKDVIAFIRSL